MLREQFLVDARLVVEAFRVARRHELDQVVIALEVLGEQHQVILRLARIPALREPAAGCDVHLAPENRIEPARTRVVVKDHRRKQVAVLRDRNRRHLQPDGLVEQFVDPARAVEQRVFGVEVEVNELGHHSHSIVEGGLELMS